MTPSAQIMVERVAAAVVGGASMTQAYRQVRGNRASRQAAYEWRTRHRVALEVAMSRLREQLAERAERSMRATLDRWDRDCEKGDAIDPALGKVVAGIHAPLLEPDVKRSQTISATLSPAPQHALTPRAQELLDAATKGLPLPAADSGDGSKDEPRDAGGDGRDVPAAGLEPGGAG